MDLVAVDIGGTNARFCIATIGDGGAVSLGDVATLGTKDYTSFVSAWEAFCAMHGGTLPRAAAVAIAGPVHDETIRFTNNPWIIQPARLHDQIGIEQQTLVNDFAAVAHAVAIADEAHFEHLCGPEGPLPADGTLTVCGPGTGLGVAHLWRDGHGGYRVQATEGGHIDFAPLDQVEEALLKRLRKRYRRVSAERVVSGPAIIDLYETLATLEGRAITPSDDKTLWTAALSGADSLAEQAAERFCLSLGSVAGDLALAQGASGVVIAGGLGYRLRELLLKSGFGARFRAKGRFEDMMASMPVRLITHPQPGLLGAAAAFAMEHKS